MQDVVLRNSMADSFINEISLMTFSTSSVIHSFENWNPHAPSNTFCNCIALSWRKSFRPEEKYSMNFKQSLLYQCLTISKLTRTKFSVLNLCLACFSILYNESFGRFLTKYLWFRWLQMEANIILLLSVHEIQPRTISSLVTVYVLI